MVLLGQNRARGFGRWAEGLPGLWGYELSNTLHFSDGDRPEQTHNWWFQVTEAEVTEPVKYPKGKSEL